MGSRIWLAVTVVAVFFALPGCRSGDDHPTALICLDVLHNDGLLPPRSETLQCHHACRYCIWKLITIAALMLPLRRNQFGEGHYGNR